MGARLWAFGCCGRGPTRESRARSAPLPGTRSPTPRSRWLERHRDVVVAKVLPEPAVDAGRGREERTRRASSFRHLVALGVALRRALPARRGSRSAPCRWTSSCRPGWRPSPSGTCIRALQGPELERHGVRLSGAPAPCWRPAGPARALGRRLFRGAAASGPAALRRSGEPEQLPVPSGSTPYSAGRMAVISSTRPRTSRAAVASAIRRARCSARTST